MNKEYDVLIIGGGPVGSIASLLLESKGFSVALVAHGSWLMVCIAPTSSFRMTLVPCLVLPRAHHSTLHLTLNEPELLI